MAPVPVLWGTGTGTTQSLNRCSSIVVLTRGCIEPNVVAAAKAINAVNVVEC